VYTIELTKEQQAGFDNQASLTGLSVQDNIQRIVGEYGDGYYKNITQADVNDMIAKIIADPTAYKQPIQDIYAAKIAAIVKPIEAPIKG
jgi:hypothetical protein